MYLKDREKCERERQAERERDLLFAYSFPSFLHCPGLLQVKTRNQDLILSYKSLDHLLPPSLKQWQGTGSKVVSGTWTSAPQWDASITNSSLPYGNSSYYFLKAESNKNPIIGNTCLSVITQCKSEELSSLKWRHVIKKSILSPDRNFKVWMVLLSMQSCLTNALTCVHLWFYMFQNLLMVMNLGILTN